MSTLYHGTDRRKAPIHPWRWRGLVLWIVIFTVAVFFSIRQIEDQSAKTEALQRTNCGLVNFLLTARRTRWDAYRHQHQKTDLDAVVGYEKLALPFLIGTVNRHEAIGNCHIADHLIIKARPYDHLRLSHEGHK